jgi:transposase
MTVLSVSDGELRRLEVLRDVDRGGLPVRAAAQLLGRSERQVWRLLKAFRSDGVAGLISKKRGRPSNRRTTASVRAAVLWVVRHNYADFGPTLAAEKLAAEHGFAFSGETLRKWMIADGLWLDRKQRQRRVHQPRPRRECVGELVQVDGSVHWWFEDRGPKCTPLVFVDDATSRLMHLQFVESESTFLCARQGSARCAAQDPSGPPISLRWCGHSRILRHRGCMISIS